MLYFSLCGLVLKPKSTSIHLQPAMHSAVIGREAGCTWGRLSICLLNVQMNKFKLNEKEKKNIYMYVAPQSQCSIDHNETLLAEVDDQKANW